MWNWTGCHAKPEIQRVPLISSTVRAHVLLLQAGLGWLIFTGSALAIRVRVLTQTAAVACSFSAGEESGHVVLVRFLASGRCAAKGTTGKQTRRLATRSRRPLASLLIKKQEYCGRFTNSFRRSRLLAHFAGAASELQAQDFWIASALLSMRFGKTVHEGHVTAALDGLVKNSAGAAQRLCRPICWELSPFASEDSSFTCRPTESTQLQIVRCEREQTRTVSRIRQCTFTRCSSNSTNYSKILDDGNVRARARFDEVMVR